MKKSLIVVFAAIALVVCLASCDFTFNYNSTDNRVDVTGRWVYYRDDMECMVELGRDGTFTLVQRVKGTESSYTGKYTKDSTYDGHYYAAREIDSDLITGTYSVEGSTMKLMIDDQTYLFTREGYSITSEAEGTWYCTTTGGLNYTLKFSSKGSLEFTVDVFGGESNYTGYFTVASTTSGSFSVKLTTGTEELNGTYSVDGDSLTLAIKDKDTLTFSKNGFHHNFALGSWVAEEGNLSYTFVIKDNGEALLTLTSFGDAEVYTGSYMMESPANGTFYVESDKKAYEGTYSVDGSLTLTIKGASPVTMTRGGSATDSEAYGIWTCTESGTTMQFSTIGDLTITISGNGFEFLYSGKFNNGAFTTTCEANNRTINGSYTVDGETMVATLNGSEITLTKGN